MANWIKDKLGTNVPLHFTAFHPDYKMDDLPSTPDKVLKKARNIAIKTGLNYVYTGNIFHKKGDSTYCPNCNYLLIERNWYKLGIAN